jgi:phosphotransferase system  glucose/maltose/N-acetylglucosamine-specific IIC component
MRLLYFTTLLLVTFPQIALAQDPTFKSVIYDLTGLLRSLVPVLVGAALLVFIGGLAQYVFQAGDQGAVETGKNRMIAGVVGLFVIATVWGLVQIVGATFGLGVTTS